MTRSQLRPPGQQTLKKYGITAEVWYTYFDLQEGCCSVCGQPFTEQRRPVIDHEHRKGFKKMKQEDKARCVRGLLHNWCNHRLVAKGMTTERAYNIYLYLLEYDERCNDSKNR